MNRRILISGGEGNLNKQLRKCNENYVLHIPTQLEMDITKINEVERVIKEFSPTHIIHTAAITRPMSIHEQNPVKNQIFRLENSPSTLAQASWRQKNQPPPAHGAGFYSVR